MRHATRETRLRCRQETLSQRERLPTRRTHARQTGCAHRYQIMSSNASAQAVMYVSHSLRLLWYYGMLALARCGAFARACAREPVCVCTSMYLYVLVLRFLLVYAFLFGIRKLRLACCIITRTSHRSLYTTRSPAKAHAQHKGRRSRPSPWWDPPMWSPPSPPPPSARAR